MKHVRLEQLRDGSDIARALGCTPADVSRFASGDQRKLYQAIRLPKKGKRRRGQFRVVYKPLDPTLRLLQKNIATVLLAHATFPTCVQGFVPGRSIASNARQHLARRFVLTADIERFFESIPLGRVRDAFISVGCTAEVAQLLARLTTRRGSLVQGSSASPVLANLVCRDLDRDLLQLSTELSCTFTRYADDITISGDTAVPGSGDIAELLLRHGFRLRRGEVRVQRRGRKQYVTGLSVFDSSHPRVPRRIKRQHRLVLHYAGKYGLNNHFDHVGLTDGNERYLEQRRIEGWIAFLHSIEPHRAAQFAGMYDDAIA